MAKQKPHFTKIKVAGTINLGEQVELVQTLRESDDTGFSSRIRGGDPALFNAVSVAASETVGNILESRLSTKPVGQLNISGKGLVTSFGIFGAPGCGKTVLLMRLLEQVLKHSVDAKERRYGALILDPKAALIEDVLEMASRVGRLSDVVIINTDYLNSPDSKTPLPVNVFDCDLDPYELGATLVLAGRAAGIDASDPFWFQEWTNLFSASLGVLRAKAYLERPPMTPYSRSITITELLDAIFNEVDGERDIRRIGKEVSGRIDELTEDMQHDVRIDVQMIERFFGQDYVGTIEAFITKAFGMFRRSRLTCYSDGTRKPGATSFYEDIIENGRIVVVSVSPAEPALAKTLSTLVKVLFQRAVLARGELLSKGVITNAVRPLVMACDEYSEIASEVPGQSMGDGQFLALARQYGCMAILATQSVNVLEASSLRETWRSVFSNFAAKIYMRLVDNETAEEATKLAGESDWKIRSRSKSIGTDGLSAGSQTELRERKNLPTTILTQVLKTGEAVVIGSLDGGITTPGTYFLHVPYQEHKTKSDGGTRRQA